MPAKRAVTRPETKNASNELMTHQTHAAVAIPDKGFASRVGSTMLKPTEMPIMLSRI